MKRYLPMFVIVTMLAGAIAVRLCRAHPASGDREGDRRR